SARLNKAPPWPPRSVGGNTVCCAGTAMSSPAIRFRKPFSTAWKWKRTCAASSMPRRSARSSRSRRKKSKSCGRASTRTPIASARPGSTTRTRRAWPAICKCGAMAFAACRGAGRLCVLAQLRHNLFAEQVDAQLPFVEPEAQIEDDVIDADLEIFLDVLDDVVRAANHE